MFSTVFNQTTSDAYIDGTLEASNASIGSMSMSGITIGARYASNFGQGSISEIIIYNSDQSLKRTAIESNMADHYGDIDLPAGFDSGNNEVDGFVAKWYDQSGVNHAVQGTATSQPKIVENGVYLGEVKFDGVDDELTTSNFISGSNFSAFSVAKCTDVSTTERQLWNFTDASLEYYGLTFNRNGSGKIAFSATTPDNDVGESGYAGTERLFSTFSGTTDGYYSDGSEKVEASIGRHSPTAGNSIGSQGTSGRYLDGTIKEIIVYNSDQSAARTNIEYNINNAYSIY